MRRDSNGTLQFGLSTITHAIFRVICIFVVCFTGRLARAAAAGQLPVTGNPEPRLEAFDRLMLTFMQEHDVYGASLAIARNGKMVYARGFGYADLASHQPVEPGSLFRIASVSKPFTSAAILQLQERGKLKLDESAFRFIGLSPHLEKGAKVDPRLWHVTIRQLLHHMGGFDRGASFDPMFRPIQISRAMGTKSPAMPREIIRYMMGRPLDFDPGSREAYSNFGYCVLGRVIEKASGMSYAAYVRSQVLQPLGIYHMRMGRSLEQDRAKEEVHYYPRGNAHVKSVYGDDKTVPVAYGGWCIEAMDSHGGWIASAPELVQFAGSLGDPERCPFLGAKSIHEMFLRPRDTGYSADGTPKAAYYADGWEVRPVGNGKANFWHAGLLDGTASLLVHRYDGITWAVLFNGDYDANHQYLGDLIDPLLHPVADGIKRWPEGWEFGEEPPRR
jgi:CubicO group peptidase (beta-lactamase class C family)